MITLKDVNEKNYQEIFDLKVTKEQQSHVASNLYSIAQTKIYEHCQSVSIYKGKKAIGYMMYGRDLDEEEQNPWIVRFMIDKKYQHKGYGREAFHLLLARMDKEFPHEDIYLSTSPDNTYVIKFYESEGFISTGRINDGELVFVKPSPTKNLRKETKEKIQKILNGEIKTFDVNQMVSDMLTFIGDTDPVFKDDLIYELFVELIWNHKLDYHQMIELLQKVWSKDHLFYYIGEENSDTVFNRAFSALVFAELIRYHKKHPYLSLDLIDEAVSKAHLYLTSEKDERGFVPIKAWAHATAHGADILRRLAELDELTLKQKKLILNSVIRKINDLKYAFTAQEDERLSLIYMALLENDIPLNVMTSSLSQMIDQIEPMDILKKQNTKTFLKALRDRLILKEMTPKLVEHINALLKMVVRY